MNVGTLADKRRHPRVLLIEDNRGDVILTQRAFETSKFATDLSVATTGEEGLRMLFREGHWQQQETPDLILLDLNLPLMNGFEVLKEIKQHPEMKRIPVVILTSARALQDVTSAYGLYAAGYIVKPLGQEGYEDVVDKVQQYWVTLVSMAGS